MAEIFCQQCRYTNKESPYYLSCSHKMCIDCLAHNLLSSNFDNLQDKSTFTINCKCKTGFTEITIDNYNSFLIEYLNKKPGYCKMHNNEGICFCKQCQMWLCIQCKETFHDKCYSYHILHEQLSKAHKCKVHVHKETEIYCKTCHCEICYQCISEGEEHYGHNIVKFESYYNKVKDNLQMFQYKTYEEFDLMVKSIESKFKKDYEDNISIINNKIDDIMNKIKKCKEEFQMKMDSKYKRVLSIVEVLKNLMKVYYNDVNKNEISFSLLKQINKLNKELCGINYVGYYGEELNTVNMCLENFEKCCGFTYEFMFNDVMRSEQYKRAYTQSNVLVNTINNTQTNNNGNNVMKINKSSIQLGSGNVNWLSTKDNTSYNEHQVTNNNKHNETSNITNININLDITLQEKSGELLGLIYIKKYNYLVSCSNDTFIKFWDIKSKKEKMLYSGHTKTVTCLLELQHDRLASGSYDNIIIIWNLKKNKQEYQLIGHSSQVLSLSELHNGNVVSGSWDNTIKIWNLSKQKEEATLISHKGAICSLCTLSNGHLASGSSDQTIKIWNTSSYKEIMTLYGHTMTVFCLIELNDGRLCSGSADKTVKIWDISKRICLSSINAGNGWIYCLTLLNNDYIITGSKDNVFRIWDTTRNALIYESAAQNGYINSLVVIEGKYIAVGVVGEINLYKVEYVSE